MTAEDKAWKFALGMWNKTLKNYWVVVNVPEKTKGVLQRFGRFAVMLREDFNAAGLSSRKIRYMTMMD